MHADWLEVVRYVHVDAFAWCILSVHVCELLIDFKFKICECIAQENPVVDRFVLRRIFSRIAIAHSLTVVGTVHTPY